MPVVAAVKLDDHRALGVGPGQTNGAHGGLRSGVHQPDLLHRRHGGYDFFSQEYLGFRWGPVTGSQRCSPVKGLEDLGVGMPQNHGAPGPDVIDINLVVYVDNLGTRRPGNE